MPNDINASNTFSVLNNHWMRMLLRDLQAANVLYHLLGGKETHTVMLTRTRWHGWNNHGRQEEICSCEMLAKDHYDLCHSMTIRFINSLAILSDFEEHPLADIWEYQVGGKDYFSTPASQMQVYFLKNKLPGDKQVCRAGFPLIADDLVMHVENPTQIISTAVNDGSELASLVQYLLRPSAHCTKYGALADRVDLLLDAWQAKKQKDAVC